MINNLLLLTLCITIHDSPASLARLETMRWLMDATQAFFPSASLEWGKEVILKPVFRLEDAQKPSKLSPVADNGPILHSHGYRREAPVDIVSNYLTNSQCMLPEKEQGFR